MAEFSLNVFSKEQVNALHNATLQVLEKTGVKVQSGDAADMFGSNGCTVERAGNDYLIKIPADVVEAAIRSAPRKMMLYGRDPAKDFVLEPGAFSFVNGHCVVHVVDPFTREYRPAMKNDCGEIARIGDFLSEFKVFSRPLFPNDVPGESIQLHNFEAIVNNTAKHFFCDAGSANKLDKMIEMGAAVSGGEADLMKRPFFSVICAPSSPLVLDSVCADVIIRAASRGICVNVITMATAGGTSPATLAGTLVVNNAEILAGIILAQLVRRGAPCIYGSCSTMMDLRRGMPACGAPEGGLIQAGAAALSQFYEMPSYLGPAFWTGSKQADLQAAYEGVILALTVSLARGSICWGAGIINNLMAIDYAKLIMDAEAARNIRKVLSGVSVDDEAIATEVIHEVGPGNHFMAHGHTLSHMRELSECGLYDWNHRDEWLRLGSRDLMDRAYEKVQRILETHRTVPVNADAKKTISAILSNYEKKKGVHNEKHERGNANGRVV